MKSPEIFLTAMIKVKIETKIGMAEEEQGFGKNGSTIEARFNVKQLEKMP